MSKRATSSSSSSDPARPRARRLRSRDRGPVVARLAEGGRENLFLLDLAAQLGLPPNPGEARSELVGVYEGEQLCGVAALRPSVVLDAHFAPAGLDALAPHLLGLDFGLVKSSEPLVGSVWARMAAAGNHAYIDREENAYALDAPAARLVEPAAGQCVRAAREADLDDLVFAARASLREEGRPDSYENDPHNFVRWVRGRTARATLVEHEGRIGFVGYADVRRPQGWLLQGVYTWPEVRRRGLAAAGVSALCRDAFAAGASHVQLSVVAGNEPAEHLYAGLGFAAFARLRTVLFG